MSKFDELAVPAAKYSRTIFENRRQCQRAAELVMRGYAEFLGCPLENVDFIQLDGNLNATASTVKFGEPVPMVLDGNACWYFCGRIRFKGPDPIARAHELFKLGLKYHDGLLTIHEDQDFQADPADAATLLPFFEHLYEASRAGFGSPLVKQSKRIGFALWPE